MYGRNDVILRTWAFVYNSNIHLHMPRLSRVYSLESSVLSLLSRVFYLESFILFQVV